LQKPKPFVGGCWGGGKGEGTGGQLPPAPPAGYAHVANRLQRNSGNDGGGLFEKMSCPIFPKN